MNIIKFLKNINDLENFHKKFEKDRFDLEYDVDGLVYKINSLRTSKKIRFYSKFSKMGYCS